MAQDILFFMSQSKPDIYLPSSLNFLSILYGLLFWLHHMDKPLLATPTNVEAFFCIIPNSNYCLFLGFGIFVIFMKNLTFFFSFHLLFEQDVESEEKSNIGRIYT